jgi:hypothetical protein
MEKTSGGARRRQLLAAVSILGISLGMGVEAAQAGSDNGGTQVSQKDQSSLKLKQGQQSIKIDIGQGSQKTQDSLKIQNSDKHLPVSDQQKGNAWSGTPGP